MLDNWYPLESPPSHQSGLARQTRPFLPSGESILTCVHTRDRIARWPDDDGRACVPAIHSRWTPRPYREEFHPGKPQKAVLPVNRV